MRSRIALALLLTTSLAVVLAQTAICVSTFSVKGSLFQLVQIPSGDFQMGSDNPTERPRHAVHVPSFEIGRTEVTVSQYLAFTKATGYRTDGEKEGWTWICCATKPEAATWRSRGYWERREGADWRHPGFAQSEDDPVVALSWHDAVAFCKWLSVETGKEYRLPSEAEWEYAARAGNTADAPSGVDGLGWYIGNSGLKTHPAGAKTPSAWGVHDMLGNAWEWVADVWTEDHTGAPSDGTARRGGGGHNPQIEAGDGRILRGGAWGLERGTLRFTDRAPFASHQRCNNSGFRIARSLP